MKLVTSQDIYMKGIDRKGLMFGWISKRMFKLIQKSNFRRLFNSDFMPIMAV